MDELQLLMEDFASALRSIPTALAEVGAELKRWGTAVASAASATVNLPSAIGGKLMSAADAYVDFMRRHSRDLDPVFNAVVNSFKAVGNALGPLAAPLVSQFKNLASVVGDVGITLKIMATDVTDTLKALGSAIAPVVSGFAKLASGGIETAFAALAPALTAVRSGFVSLASGLRGLTGTLTTATTGALATAFGGLTSMLGGLAGALGIAGKGLASLAPKMPPTLAGAAGKAATGDLGGALSGGAAAIMGPLQGLANAVQPFVQALNPNLMKLFNQALRDLMATFGVAFAPVIKHVSALFNELSATLTPAMHALAPIIDNLMSVLEGNLVPIIGMIADAFVALSPVIEFVTSIMASAAEAMRVVYTVFRSAIQVFYDVIKQLFGGVDLKGAANGIREVIQTLTKYFVQFAAYVAKALGYLDPFAKALEKNLRDLEGKAPGTKAAPENVHVSGLEQISKDLAVAAYAAQAAGGTRKKSEAEFLEQLIKEVEEVKKNGKTLEQFLEEMKDKLINGVMDDLSKLWDKFLAWWESHNPAQLAADIGRESQRHRQLEDQAQDMRRRHGIAEPTRRDPTFWDNLFS